MNDTKTVKLHKNNSGFTLIELIIAIAILAIVAAPLCHAYASAARTNAKARKLEAANAVAENVMEGLKSYTFDEIYDHFCYGAGVGSPVSTDFLISAGAGTPGFVTAIDHATVTTDTLPNKIVYKLTNLTEDVYDFDLRITVDAAPYSAVNDDDVYSIDQMNKDRDYMYVQKINSDDAGVAALANQMLRTKAEIYNNVKRNIKLIVKRNADNSVQVTTQISYSYGNSATDVIMTVNDSRKITDAAADPTDGLRNVFLCYYPFYSAVSGKSDFDKIEIYNESNIDCNFFIYKEVAIAGASLGVKEGTYVPMVYVHSGALSGDKTVFPIYTNLHKNLYDGSDLSTPPSYKITYVGDVGNVTSTDSSKIDLHRQLQSEQTRRMYSATVEVYENPGGSSITESGDVPGMTKVTALTSEW